MHLKAHPIRPLFLGLVLGLMGCFISSAAQSQQFSDSILKLTIHSGEQYQKIHGFGASDAWSIRFVGEYWPLDKRNTIADLLFSKELNEQGNPEGIGLSVWRFNIGAGSARQGSDSGIDDPWRRAESFLTADSTYNWTRQAGQQWFMKAAHKRGVETFIGFVNSPPILLTENGYAYGDGDGDANIASRHYSAFADYLARIADHFNQQGITLDYLSPVNEPQWDWSQDNGQEGSPYQNMEIAGVVEALDRKIREFDLDTKIEIPETARIDFLHDGDLEGRNRQTDFFWGSDSTVKQLATLAKKMAAHSYFTTWPVEQMIEQRRQLWKNLQQVSPNVEYWMSEYCILADNEEIQGNGKDLGMDPALYVARIIHYDMTVAHASSWQWWLAVSPYNYKDGLVYIDKNRTDGVFTDSKLLWALGNYSRFIRPGATRIGISRSDQKSPTEQGAGLMASAYVNETTDNQVVVIVNYGTLERQISLQSEGMDELEYIPYVTSETTDLQRGQAVKTGQQVSVPSRSVVTYVAQ